MESKEDPVAPEKGSFDLFKLSSRWASVEALSSLVVLTAEEEPSYLNTFNSSGMFQMVSMDKMSVQYVGSPQHGYDVGAVQANCPAPTRRIAYYFEMTVKDAGQKGQVAIGFTTKEFNLRRQPGWEANSCGYHGDDGYLYHGHGKGEPFGPPYTSDDTVGAGINYSTQEFFFTKNGELVGTVCKDIKGLLFPTIAVHGPNEEVTVNFGKQPFRFDIEAFILKERLKQEELIDKLVLSPNVSHCTLMDTRRASKRLRPAIDVPEASTTDPAKAIVSSAKKPLHATPVVEIVPVPKTELVPRNVELLSLRINPDYHQRLINSGELGFERPVNRRVPTARFYEIQLDNFKAAMSKVLTDYLTWKLFEQGKLTSVEITTEVTAMTPIIVDACITALYSKMRMIHRQYGRYMHRFANPPTYARDVELPLPFADAIQNFGVFEPQNVLTNFIYVPVYPEGVQNEGRSTQEWNSYKYEAYIPILKSLGIPVKSVDTRLKAGSSWWLFQVKYVERHFDYVCIFPPSNYSDHSTLVATMFSLLNVEGDALRPIIKYNEEDQLFPVRCRDITVGFALRAFSALCHAHRNEWSCPLPRTQK